LVNDSCFYQENNYEGTSNDILRKCISIAECVISLHKKQFTPFSVGLALQFHHEYETIINQRNDKIKQAMWNNLQVSVIETSEGKG
jgi:hypothetical protein